jgi:hypothetical protein
MCVLGFCAWGSDTGLSQQAIEIFNKSLILATKAYSKFRLPTDIFV